MPHWPIYFWEGCISPHKLPLFRALMDRPEIGPCTYVTQAGLPDDRAAQGWETGSTDGIDLRFAPDAEEIDRIMRDADPDAMHFFSGTHWVPCITDGIRAAIRHGRHFGLTVEPRVREGWKGKLRLLHSWATERHIRTHVEAVMAIGRNGPPWFRIAGYPAEKIFPFAYYLPDRSDLRAPLESAPLRVGYLGRLIEPKGIRLFLEAVKHLSIPCEIVVAGAGEDAPLVEAAARDRPSFRFAGVLPMSEVPDFLADLDILVVPSITTDDGWGAVVSEALIAGVAVVATSKVGASICLDCDWRGAVVHSLRPDDVATAIERLGSDPVALRSQRRARAEWGNTHLSGKAGAAYVVNVLDHLRNQAPRPLPFYE